MYARTVLMGYLGRDAEIRSTQNGNKCMSLNVATNSRVKNKAGEYEERTSWHRVTVWGDRLIDAVAQYAVKGALVFVEGAPESRSYEQNGETKYSHEVVVSTNGILRIPPPPKSGYTQAASSNAPSGKNGSSPRRPSRPLDEYEDDIPF